MLNWGGDGDDTPMTSKTVLVASGAPDIRDRFFVALGGAGHRALGAASARELRDVLQARAGDIDLVVLDARMGDGGARHVVETVRRAARNAPVSVFSGSVHGARELRELAELGVAGYINEHVEVQRILPVLAPLLFPNNFDRRTSARVTLGIPAALTAGDTILPVFTLNIGSGGMAVRATTALAAGARVSIRFKLPRSSREIEAAARVVWSHNPQAALGLQFETVAAPDQIAIDEFVERHAADPGAPA